MTKKINLKFYIFYSISSDVIGWRISGRGVRELGKQRFASFATPMNISTVVHKANSKKNKEVRSDAVMAPDNKSIYNKDIVPIEFATHTKKIKNKFPQQVATHPGSFVNIFFLLIVGK